MLTSNVATIALGICLAGTAWRISRWFLSDIGSESDGLSTGRRLAATGRALLGALIHPGIWKNTRIFLWEIVLQGHLLQQQNPVAHGHMYGPAQPVLLKKMTLKHDFPEENSRIFPNAGVDQGARQGTTGGWPPPVVPCRAP